MVSLRWKMNMIFWELQTLGISWVIGRYWKRAIFTGVRMIHGGADTSWVQDVWSLKSQTVLNGQLHQGGWHCGTIDVQETSMKTGWFSWSFLHVLNKFSLHASQLPPKKVSVTSHSTCKPGRETQRNIWWHPMRTTSYIWGYRVATVNYSTRMIWA